MSAWPPVLLFAAVLVALMAGYPVALTLSGVALLGAGLGAMLGVFDPAFLGAFPNRVFGIVTNETLIAVPAFVFMGAMLERSRIAGDLLTSMAELMGSLRGGLGLAVVLVGALLAASTGIVGATVVTMGLLALPSMLERGYSPRLAAGSICAAGTLGQIIPPSIALVLLGDVLSNAYQRAQIAQGRFNPDTVSVGDLFAGALLPGLALVALYMIYLAIVSGPETRGRSRAARRGESAPQTWRLLGLLLAPLLLIVLVLGSILAGLATPTEAAGVGAVGATALAAWQRRLSRDTLGQVVRRTAQVTSMVFLILIGATLFSLVFRGFGGDEVVRAGLSALPGGALGAMVVVMVAIFLLGFVLDFIEITYVVVPIVGPVLLAMGLSPIWLGVMIAINLQTSFLTPPFGFALFYLRGVAPDSVATGALYRGVLPFVCIQLSMLVVLALWPQLATWLPGMLGK